MAYEIEIPQSIIDSPETYPRYPYGCAIARTLNKDDDQCVNWVDEDTIFSAPADDEEDHVESYMSPELIKWHNNYIETGTASPITIIFDDDVCFVKGLERYGADTDFKVRPAA